MERKTRYEIMFLLDDKDSKSVNNALTEIRKMYNNKFIYLKP